MEMMTEEHVEACAKESSTLFAEFDRAAKGHTHASIVYASCDILIQSINIASENEDEREAAVETAIGIIRNGVQNGRQSEQKHADESECLKQTYNRE